MSGLAHWKVVPVREDGKPPRWMIERNGVPVLDEPMIFKGQAVRLKERWRKNDEANARDAMREARQAALSSPNKTNGEG